MRPARAGASRGSAGRARDAGAHAARERLRAGSARPSALRAGSGRRAPSRRRDAYASASEDGGSSHWRSSTATIRGVDAARARSAFSRPTPIAPASGAAPVGVARSNGTSRAWRCGAGSAASSSVSTPSKRSMRPANARLASASLGRAESTRNPACRAAVDAGFPQGRLPDPGPADEDDGAGVRRVGKLLDGRELALSPDDTEDLRFHPRHSLTSARPRAGSKCDADVASACQRRSTTAAIAWPCPMHIEAMP